MSGPNLRGGWSRRESMLRVGVAMMFHDRAKLIGTLLGVVFATVLMIQQLGTFLGLLYKNTQFVDNTQADVWVLPPGVEQALPGSPIPLGTLPRSRVVEGVAWAEPLLMGGAAMTKPDGGREAVTLVGTRLPRQAGGPWGLVGGDAQRLAVTDTVIVDDGQRDALGGVNLGSVRELSGRKVTVGGFTWGLLPFGPGYAFANYETARSILNFPSDQTSFVLVGVDDGVDPERVAESLRAELGDAVEVKTKAGFRDAIANYLIGAQLGITFGTSTVFALIVGFVIVALSMFSAVVDNVREFGVLKAMGATNVDLTVLLLAQSLLYAVIGTTAGLFLASGMSEGIRSANLVLVLPTELLFGSYGVMALLCAIASVLAILRVRNIEPGMVFR
ncbi:MAG: ABC transporter permease [Myxococcota bacterium]